jgi:hypothetical protein
MPLLNLSPLIVPKAPRPGEATQEEFLTWANAMTQALELFRQNLDTAVDAFISSTAQMGTGVIVADNIQAGVIVADLISTTGAIITNVAQIQDALITDAKIINLDGAKINAQSITSEQIVTSALIATEIAVGAIDDPLMFANGVVASAAFALSSVSGTTIAAGGISSAAFALSSVSGTTIAAGGILTNAIAAGAVTAAKMSVAQLSAITADMGALTAGTVTGATIRTAASGARVQMDSLNGLKLYDAGGTERGALLTNGSGYFGHVSSFTWTTNGDVTIDGDRLVGQSVLTAAIADANITAAKIGAAAVEAAKIANNAVTTAAINALAVSTAKIDALAVTTAKLNNLATTTGKRQVVNTQTTTGTPLVNSGSGPVLFSVVSATFTHNLGTNTLVTGFSSSTTHPVHNSNNGANSFSMAMQNLSGSSALTPTYGGDYW